MFKIIYSIINIMEVIIFTEKVNLVTLGTFAKTVVVGQHQTMMNAILNLLLVNYVTNAKASKKIKIVESSCVSNNLIF